MGGQKNIMLLLTQNCNLDCIYCYEYHKSEAKMDFYTAKKIMEKEFSDKTREGFLIEFFGGEPFLNFDLIVDSYNYVLHNHSDKNVHFFITTNGTLLTNEMKRWLKERKNNISCGLSIDGTEEMHNLNRSNSFSFIDLDFFIDNWPEQNCKMTISPLTINLLSEGIIFLSKRGFNISATFAQGMKFEKNLVDVFQQELFKVVDFYLENPEYKICDLLDANILSLGFGYKNRKEKWCGAGKDLVAYDTDGCIYPCQMFTPVSIGEKATCFKEKNEDFLAKKYGFEDSKCDKCLFLSICPTCYGINFAIRGDISRRDDELCEFHKRRFYASAYLKYIKIFRNKKSDKKLTREEYILLKGIKNVVDFSDAESVSWNC